ncbi:sure-like protein [Clavulina sp. PMI_390]|nr:sure-like protein [Clavulina sp. PMI_390]
MTSTSSKIRILLTNDDGPPSRDSPFILDCCSAPSHLAYHTGHDVKVVIPSAQNSWIGKAYRIKEKIFGRYYYPRVHGVKPETSDVSRPLKEGELGEWILLDGTPATCANIGLHNLFPDQIDLVISGPNLGRNTSSAFVLSSGTIGAAMSSSLAMVRSIALSYGVFSRPSPSEYVDPAHELGIRIIHKLWNNWGSDPSSPRNGETELYNVNIPLVKELLNPGSLEVVWTTIWRNQYASLFQEYKSDVSPASPDAPPASTEPTLNPDSSSPAPPAVSAPALSFHFAPTMGSLVNPPLESLPFGSDAWAVHHAKASVTPLRTSFAEPGEGSFSNFFDDEPAANGTSKGPGGMEFVGRPWKL